MTKNRTRLTTMTHGKKKRSTNYKLKGGKTK